MPNIDKIRVNNIDYNITNPIIFNNTERIVGTYFGEDLYQKDFNNLTYSSNNETKDLGFDSTINIIDFHQVYIGQNLRVSGNFSNTTNMYFNSDNTLQCCTTNGDSGWSRTFRLSVWYTKTTDTVS